MNNVSAAIIGGGKSLRFGEPKSFAKFANRRLIEYSVKLAREISSQIFIVSEPHLNYAEYNLKTYYDIISGCGPLGGVYTALYHAKTDYVASIPVDMPLLTPVIYKILYKKLEPGKPIVALSEKGMEPLIAIWPRMAIDTLKQAIAEKRFSLHKSLRKLNAVHIFIPNELQNYKSEFFHNINYRNDLELKLDHNKNILEK